MCDQEKTKERLNGTTTIRMIFIPLFKLKVGTHQF